ncbi:hypothetical protein ON064_04030 [Planococcus sp. A6]|uniref:hypothetical protein n=1 Tax=Planococcus sp. A6 TaxID=2992760 RepID=UPI00237C1062|nr:hypothetical protein [Planococcus sp. A6]MDE0582214.1 hypothetical protein [Planococcus sp. A6]
MWYPEKHMAFWIKELHDYGVYEGPNGEPLEELEYHDLRAFLSKKKLQRDLHVKSSPWF